MILCDVCKKEVATGHICSECLEKKEEVAPCDFCAAPSQGHVCDSCAEKAKTVIFPEEEEKPQKTPKYASKRRTAKKKQRNPLETVGHALRKVIGL